MKINLIRVFENNIESNEEIFINTSNFQDFLLNNENKILLLDTWKRTSVKDFLSKLENGNIDIYYRNWNENIIYLVSEFKYINLHYSIIDESLKHNIDFGKEDLLSSIKNSKTNEIKYLHYLINNYLYKFDTSDLFLIQNAINSNKISEKEILNYLLIKYF